jgi:hypothetical protein
VEIAKEFCAAQAPGFVNGILGAALRALRENGARVPDPALERSSPARAKPRRSCVAGELAPERAPRSSTSARGWRPTRRRARPRCGGEPGAPRRVS